MINKLLLTLSLFVSLSFGNIETISLTGEYAKNDLSNPFKVLLEKKEKTISVNAENKDVVLKVENDLDESKYASFLKNYPKEVIFKNDSIVNVLKAYYQQDYFVDVKEKADITVNVLKGNILLEHFFHDDDLFNPSLRKITVTIDVEFIKNGMRRIQTFTMDHKLNKEDTAYKRTLRTEDFKIRKLSIATDVPRIIENIIFTSKGL